MEKSNNISEKNATINMLKALAIIFVVMIHIGHDISHEALTYLPAWRMPAFIFISGYLFKRKHCLDIKGYVVNKFQTLMIPTFSWHLFYGSLVTVLLTFGIINFGSQLSLKTLFLDSILYGQQYAFTSALWFVPVLFACQCIYVVLVRYNDSLRFDVLLLFMFIMTNIMSVWCSRNNLINANYPNLLLFSLKVSFFLVFFHIGSFYRKYIELYDFTTSAKMLIALMVNYVIVAFFCGNDFTASKLQKIYFDVSWMTFYNDYPWTPFITSVVGIYFWFHVAKILSVALGKKDVIMKIGEKTFPIMVHHIFGFWICNNLLLFLQKHNIIYIAFNEIEFNNNVWYKCFTYWPFNDMIYFLCAIGVSLLIDSIYMKIKMIFKK